MPAAVCVNSVNRGCSPVHARTHVGADQCPRCFCLRFNFRCSKRASASSARRWLLARTDSRFIASRWLASVCCALVPIAGCLRALDASRARLLGFFAGLFTSVGSSPKNESFAHLPVMKCRISSLDGSAPKTMRATPYLPSSTCSASPTQNWPVVIYGQGGRHADLHGWFLLYVDDHAEKGQPRRQVTDADSRTPTTTRRGLCFHLWWLDCSTCECARHRC